VSTFTPGIIKLLRDAGYNTMIDIMRGGSNEPVKRAILDKDEFDLLCKAFKSLNMYLE
jgi:hypothetical protein